MDERFVKLLDAIERGYSSLNAPCPVIGSWCCKDGDDRPCCCGLAAAYFGDTGKLPEADGHSNVRDVVESHLIGRYKLSFAELDGFLHGWDLAEPKKNQTADWHGGYAAGRDAVRRFIPSMAALP